ncbi:RHS repeat-associated core domain-containing protein [Pseudomonas silesiensis]|uniref:RHS repeat-associated core domain-containing protein n=1 Tax=Pseudomonas silesiensis TaxID=1853130 RepID=UPI0009ED4DAE|nr:RHS repeat-associated core domain-containing protein [Pseudomonas silesiensis]
MSTSSLKMLCRYQYDPLDRLTGVGVLEGARNQRFYQEDHLTTKLGEQTQRTIFRHEAQPLAQLHIAAGGTETTLLATDQADSLLQAVRGTNPQQLAYTAYGHHPAERGLSRLLGFNGECPDSITGHYLLGQGKRAFNPVLMRFNSPDELSPFGAGGINPYAYCEGDPINFSDPSGNGKFKIILDLAERTARRTKLALTNTPLNTTHRSSHSIARAARSASTSNPIVDTATPIASPIKTQRSKLPPEKKAKRTRTEGNPARTKHQQQAYEKESKLAADARKYDAREDNPSNYENTELRNKFDVLNQELSDIRARRAPYEQVEMVRKRAGYARRIAKQSAITSIENQAKTIRNK